MQIIIPLSGVGRRFLEKGYSVPKPLLEVEGMPIIEHVINMFPGEDDFIFICNKDHLKNTNLHKILRKLKPSGRIIGIPPHNFGPVYAVLKASKFIDDKKSTIVNYCDFNVDWDYLDFKRTISNLNPSGALTCYTGFHPHLLRRQLYAGVLVDENLRMIKIKEKTRFTEDPMQTWHSSGMYYFKSGEILKKYFDELIKKDMHLNGEFYVSTVYELLLRDGLFCQVYPLNHFLQWGTPEDLEEYLSWSNLFRDISSGKVKEENIICKDDNERKTFHYWRKYFNKVNSHPYKI